mgnify:CR=1 FL=1
MARRPLSERNTRKLYRNSGGTVLVSIPKEIIDNLRWRDGQKVTVKQSGQRIVIEDWEG